MKTQGSFLGLGLFNMFINYLEGGGRILLKFTNDTKLGKTANISENRNKVENHLDYFIWKAVYNTQN